MVDSLKYIRPKIFADYTNIFHKDLKTLYLNANEDLHSLSNWLIANKLSLSVDIDKDSRYTTYSPTNLIQIYPNSMLETATSQGHPLSNTLV